MKKCIPIPLTVIILLCLLWPLPSQAGPNNALSKGQTIYVPAYSHIYSGDREKPFLLTVTLSIRNIDPNHSIQVARVDYHETQGDLLRKYLEKPLTLKPLESVRYVVPQSDSSGGSGANFIVKWRSEKQPVNPPIVETIMIGTQIQQGISFTSRGRVIHDSHP